MATLNVSDLVLVWAGPGTPEAPAIPIAARVLDVGEPYWIDICMLGQHLPQMYQSRDLQRMTAELAASHGLCPECLGYGALGDVPVASALDQVPDPCGTCGGTGRSALRVTITRTAGTIQARMEAKPHEPLTVKGFVGCVACGFPLDGPGAELSNHVPSADFCP